MYVRNEREREREKERRRGSVRVEVVIFLVLREGEGDCLPFARSSALNMIPTRHLIFLANVLLCTSSALPYKRLRRQMVPNRNENLPYEGWGGSSNNPSGAVPGAYYGQ